MATKKTIEYKGVDLYSPKTKEYKIITIVSDLAGVEMELNALAKAGWEVLPISINQSGNVVTFNALARR